MVTKPKKTEKKSSEKSIKNITMKDIMNRLGIEVNDIVCVYANGYKHYLICNELYDLVRPAGNYESTVPNLILGMVSDKYSYEVFSSKYKVDCMSNEPKRR